MQCAVVHKVMSSQGKVMKKLILKLFAQLTGNKQNTVPLAANDNLATASNGSENGVRCQLVQVLMRDLLRKHGIPPQWMDCQMTVVSSRTKGPGMYLRLIVHHWDERLMNYASAFQKELVSNIMQFEPQAAQWLHAVSWQLEVEGSCPYTTLPSKSFWLEVKPNKVCALQQESSPESDQQLPRQPVEPTTETVDRLQLERLFAVRDEELSAQAHHDTDAQWHEKTQPMPLLELAVNTEKKGKALQFG